MRWYLWRAWPGCQSIGGDLLIQANSVLPDLEGLAGLARIEGLLLIIGNSALQSLAGLRRPRLRRRGFADRR